MCTNIYTDNIEKKIKNLRTQYTLESQKTKEMKSDAGTDEVYTSKWPYYTCSVLKKC